MIEFFLVLSLIGTNPTGAVAVTTVPSPFASLEECTSAGRQAKVELIDGGIFKGANFSCVKRTRPAS